MKKVWKWILGIVIVLVVVAVLVGAAFTLRSSFGVERYTLRGDPQLQTRNDQNFGPMMGHGWNLRGPMMGRGITRFGGGMMFFGGLMMLGPLVVLGLLIYGAYWLGKRKVTPVAVVTPAPVAPATPLRTCPKCGYSVNDGWNHCSNCGKKL
jgi:hypothetical protein